MQPQSAEHHHQGPPYLTVHTASWATQLTADLNAARATIRASALSILAPTPHMHGPWPVLWRAILAAPDRGISVRLAIPRPTKIHPATLWNHKAALQLQNAGVTVLWCDAPRLVHAKAWAIDCEILWCGSGNLTAAACHHNREAWLRAFSPGQATFLHHWIEHLPTGT